MLANIWAIFHFHFQITDTRAQQTRLSDTNATDCYPTGVIVCNLSD